MSFPIDIAALVEILIAFTLLESVALVLYHRVTGRGVAPRDWLLSMVSGLCLMAALRCLARDSGASWIVVFLLAAGVAHGTDIWIRLRRASRAPGAHRRVAA